MMAEDEYRYNFDAYSIFKTSYNNHYKVNNSGNLYECILPGAHADVGGGYNEESELIYLGKSNSDLKVIKNRIEVWNKKFTWLEINKIEEITNRVFLKKRALKRKR